MTKLLSVRAPETTGPTRTRDVNPTETTHKTHTGTNTVTKTSSTPTPTATDSASSGAASPLLLKILLPILGALVIAAIVWLVWWYRRRARRRRDLDASDAGSAADEAAPSMSLGPQAAATNPAARGTSGDLLPPSAWADVPTRPENSELGVELDGSTVFPAALTSPFDDSAQVAAEQTDRPEEASHPRRSLSEE